MKILFLSDGITPFVVGGMQQHSYRLAKYLVLNGNEVTLFHFVQKGQPIPSESEINKLFFNNELKFKKVFCFYFPSSVRFPGHYLYNSYRYSNLVYQTIKNNINNFDFVYSKGFSAWKLLHEKAKGNFKTKVGVKFHGYEMYQYAPNFKIKMQHLMLRPFVKKINLNADVVFSYGGKITQIIKSIGVPDSKTFDVPSAIDSDWISQKKLVDSKLLKFLFVGRYERRKGVDEINEAIRIMAKSDLKAEFHFVGPIPKKQQLNISGFKIVYHGLINDIEERQSIYDRCDVLLCPSYSEGMPNVILEAMSRGLAIIATDIGAICDMVCDKNGILLENNKPFTILESIIVLKSNKLKLVELKQNSVTKVREKFSSDIVFKKLIQTIKFEINC